MMRQIYFTVAGIPRPALPAPTKEQEALRRAWRALVTDEAVKHRVTFVKQSPLCVRLTFQIPPPKSATTEWAATWASTTDLADEIVDALIEGGLLIDARQVVRLEVRKRYGAPGCVISVTDVHNQRSAA